MIIVATVIILLLSLTLLDIVPTSKGKKNREAFPEELMPQRNLEGQSGN